MTTKKPISNIEKTFDMLEEGVKEAVREPYIVGMSL